MCNCSKRSFVSNLFHVSTPTTFQPTTCSPGIPFPKHFLPAAKKIFTRMYRVFVHVYIHHFDKLIAIGAVSCPVAVVRAFGSLWRGAKSFPNSTLQEAHINTCYKHFYYFVTEFKLIDVREFEPLVSNETSAFVPLLLPCLSLASQAELTARICR